VPAIAVLSMKGGVGKTTVTLGLASAAWKRGLRTLVIDLDPQANATMGLGVDAPARTVNDVLADARPGTARDAVTPSAWGSKTDVIAAERALEFRNVPEGPASHLRLRTGLAALPRDYDLVIVDCPPSIGELTRNALAAVDAAIVVTEPAYFALHGAQEAMDAVDVARATANPGLRTGSIVLNKVRPTVAEHRLRVQELREFYGAQVSDIVIPERNAIPQSEGAAMPIHAWDSPAGAELSRIFDALLDDVAPGRFR
jgi:chromosome partitioning protein